MVHSYNQFHAAGHGTFFSGQLRFGQAHRDGYLWVYDCGSNRHGRMSMLVADLYAHAKTDVIDMLCLSHFDGDHVNGLLELLRVFRVERLFLPYLPFNKRLQVACELDLDVAGSTDAMLFTLDPAGFLAARDLIGRVGSIVFVRGGEGDGDSPQRDIDDLPIEPDYSESKERDMDGAVPEGSEYSPLLAAGRRVRITSLSHTTPITWHQRLWEFVFYNKELPNGVASVSGANLTTIQADVQIVLGKWNLNTGVPPQIEGWQKDLRQCYERHFGASSKGKNDISLCLLARPLLKKDFDQCSLFKTPFSGLSCAHTLVPLSEEGKSGLLLTGDISINKKVLGEMKKHFGLARWKDIHVMQIPHHGSKYSWKVGCAALCEHEYSVFCVPDIDSSGLHPHLNVLVDLENRRPLYVNYSTSVVYCFHSAHQNNEWF